MLIPYPLEAPPPLPPLDDAWVEPALRLDAGRRAGMGEGDAWFHEGPSLQGLAVLGPLELGDRRMVALEEPLFVWEVETDGELQLLAEVIFEDDRVRYERSDDGSRIWLGGEETGDELLITCYGGAVEVREEGDALRLHARGKDRVRLVVVGAWSEEDRDRTLRSLARKGVAGAVAQQARHAEMIAKLGTQVSTPQGGVDAQLESDKRELDSFLLEWRDGRRTLAEPYAQGIALMTMGLREPVRDTLRAPFDDAERRWLFAVYAAWAGADDFVRRHWDRLLEGVRAAESGYRTFVLEVDRSLHQAGARDLIPVAEALGDPAAVELLEEASEGMGDPPGPDVWGEFSTELDRWHILPNALEGAVTLGPELPPEWPEMTLERLRIGESSLDVRVRRRPSGVAVKVRVTRGPPVVVHLAPVLPFAPTGVLVGTEQLAGPGIRLTVDDEIEGVWTH
jgi:hypothetical protein